MDVDVSTLVLAGVFVVHQTLQTIQIAVLRRDVRRTLRPPPQFKRAVNAARRVLRDDDDDSDTQPRGKQR